METLSSDQIDQELARLAWSLWTTLGVAGDSRQHQNSLIALEELVILTALISDSDPRLRDEALDWCSRHHHFVSVSRLRTLVKGLGKEVYGPVSVFSATLNSISQSKWPTFVKATPLKIICSKKSQPPRCEMPALLGLRLRALFGVGARADLITSLLTRQSGAFTAADMVEVGYSKRTLAEALDSFVEAGLLTCFATRNQKKYELVRRNSLRSLAGLIPKIAPDWSSILTVLVTLRTTVLEQNNNPISTRVIAARDALAQLRDQLRALNLSPPQTALNLETYWSSFVQWANNTIKALTTEDFQGMQTVNGNFEKAFSAIMQHLYAVDDCVDGLNSIINRATENSVRHQEIFKECYRTSVRYLLELKESLEQLQTFAIHRLGDTDLSEIVHRFKHEDLKSLLLFIEKLPSTEDIAHVGSALNFYRDLDGKLNKVRKFTHEIRKRLKDLYFHETDIHLLTLSPTLDKRHEVLALFSTP
jgi:hypothetical protein